MNHLPTPVQSEKSATEEANLMLEPVLIAVGIARLWYSVPLLVSISLVYAATRHEDMAPILKHAFHFGFGVIVFMLVIMAVLMFVSWRL